MNLAHKFNAHAKIRFYLSSDKTNTTLWKSPHVGLRLRGSRATWEVVRWFIATQTMTCGYQWHQKVLFKYCGNVRAARNDRTAASNLRRDKVTK